MLFKPLSKYSLVNAKVRARLSTLLSLETINKLAEATNLAEFYSRLSGTVYEDIFASPQAKSDPRMAERMLVEREVEWHRELLNDLKGGERDLIAAMLESYEIGNIKVALRIREKGKAREEELRYILTGKLLRNIPYLSIAEAKAVEDAIPLLSSTPYASSVARAIDLYHEKGTLFPIETALEIDFYKRLIDKVEALSKGDRQIAERLIGLEIDMRNLSWLVRLKFYYGLPVGELGDYMIPGGGGLKKDKLKKAFASESIRDVFMTALDRSFSFAVDLIKNEQEIGKLYILEVILWNYLVREAKKSLAGFPFTIGTILSYLILKRNEIRNLITILNGKLLGMEKESIEEHLRTIF